MDLSNFIRPGAARMGITNIASPCCLGTRVATVIQSVSTLQARGLLPEKTKIKDGGSY